MKRQIVLTVSESKRLIAKGVVALPELVDAMKTGMVVVATGTTNSYVLEELWNKKIDKRRYRSGITTPKEPEKHQEPSDTPIQDVVFRNGKPDANLDRYNAVEHMEKGDIYIKGANALNYLNNVAGVLIGSPTGGTVGAVLGNIIGKGITLIIPIGLEKLTFEDINTLHLLTSEEDYDGPRMWPLTGIIITEVEALELLTGVEATLYAAGGIAGAEGAVRLLIIGTEDEVNDALQLVNEIKGEPRYLL
jgi:hypothetical protein